MTLSEISRDLLLIAIGLGATTGVLVLALVLIAVGRRHTDARVILAHPYGTYECPGCGETRRLPACECPEQEATR